MVGRLSFLAAVALLLLAANAVDGIASPQPKPSPKRPSPKRPSPKPKTPKALAAVRNKNGIRLVGASGAKGRLEVSSTEGWVAGYEEGAVGWRPVCMEGLFSDGTAQIMCEMLGYKFGRTYYTLAVAYRPANNSRSDDPIDYLNCYSNSEEEDSGSRRMLRDSMMHASASSSSARDAASALRDSSGVDHTDQAHARSLLAPLRADVNTPATSPYSCSFRLGECAYEGPLAGLECSQTEFPAAPPPPPSPPTPPPAPPPKSGSIRLVGGNFASADIEPNLCAPDSEAYDTCKAYGRVEVKVEDEEGKDVWAPLCTIPDDYAYALASVVCKHAFDWPDKPRPSFYVSAEAGIPWQLPLETPTGNGDFNPAKYERWATVTGGDVENAVSLKELTLDVTKDRCADGLMFSVYCSIAM